MKQKLLSPFRNQLHICSSAKILSEQGEGLIIPLGAWMCAQRFIQRLVKPVTGRRLYYQLVGRAAFPEDKGKVWRLKAGLQTTRRGGSRQYMSRDQKVNIVSSGDVTCPRRYGSVNNSLREYGGGKGGF